MQFDNMPNDIYHAYMQFININLYWTTKSIQSIQSQFQSLISNSTQACLLMLKCSFQNEYKYNCFNVVWILRFKLFTVLIILKWFKEMHHDAYWWYSDVYTIFANQFFIISLISKIDDKVTSAICNLFPNIINMWSHYIKSVKQK